MEGADERDAREYLRALASGLMEEARVDLREPEASETAERGEKLLREIEAASLGTYGTWQRSLHAYESVALAVAAAHNLRARIARSYESMEELARDMEAQQEGRSRYTYWDASEHGRRRQIEAAIAARHGAEEALLLNSGMSAIAVALGAMRLSRGATILTGQRGHHATTDYLNRFVAPTGVKIVRVPPWNADAVKEALRAVRPQLALFETATSAPGGNAPARMDEWFDASPETLFVIDNSVQSLLTPWFEGAEARGRRLVVIESAARYLAHRNMAGLAYGPEALLSPMRDFARVTGQYLQEKAFNYIRPAEIEHLPWKLRRHAANVWRFLAELHEVGAVDVSAPGLTADETARASMFRNGPGCLLFVRIRAPIKTSGPYRRLLSSWQAQARKQGAWVPVRAGFGWSDTIARVFEPGPTGGQMCLRVSVGVEPAPVADRLARGLSAACAEIEACAW
jgi:cystathionine beta-lyase/cystathionine gamma-synthase